MTDKEIAEIRRRFRPERSNISKVRGCYVNEQGEILQEFTQSFHIMPQQESEELLAILKKTLSGTAGKNLIDIEFSTQQVVDSEEHKLLTAVRDSALDSDDAVHALYERIAGALHLEGCYLILLAADKYDVPGHGSDGALQEDASEVFSYFLCSICPVKATKPALGYYASDSSFRNISADWVVGAPELGFLFPAFSDRCADIYSTLYYTHNTNENHSEFTDAVFHCGLPMPAGEQKETFQSILSETVAEDCSLDVVQAVHGKLSEMIKEHKADRDAEPLTVSKDDVKDVLRSCGVSDARVDAFDQKYDDGFGSGTAVSPRNLIDEKQMELRLPDVTIRVNPERRDLLETRVIDGTKYILIRAEEGVEVNGVSISISE